MRQNSLKNRFIKSWEYPDTRFANLRLKTLIGIPKLRLVNPDIGFKVEVYHPDIGCIVEGNYLDMGYILRLVTLILKCKAEVGHPDIGIVKLRLVTLILEL